MESDELKQRVLDFLCDKIQKFLFIDYSSSGLHGNEIFDVIQDLLLGETPDAYDYDYKSIKAEILRLYQGSNSLEYYDRKHGNSEEIISNSSNLVVLQLPEEVEIDIDRLKKRLDLVNRDFFKKIILVSKKKDYFDVLFDGYTKAGMLKLKKPEHNVFPIHNIVLRDVLADIKDLVHKHADINEQDENKDTPLHLAIKNGRIDVAHQLLRLGADVNLGNQEDQTVLHIALEKNFRDVANTILTKNVNVTLKDVFGYTALHYAGELGAVDIIKKLVEKGADINLQNENMDTPLHLAVENGRIDLVRQLLSFGADFNLRNKKDQTVLHVALNKNFLDIAKIILTESVDVNLKDNIFGHTALHLAARLGDVGIIKKLVEKGADVNTKNCFNFTPLMYACEGGEDAVEYLLPLSKDVDIARLFMDAVKIDNVHLISILVDSGADVNFKYQGLTPLYTAAGYGKLNTVNALLCHGADPNAEILFDIFTLTPLKIAVLEGHKEVVQRLLQAGSKVDTMYEGNKNIVHIAAEQQPDKDILLVLLENNADALSKDKEGNTALHYAIKNNNCTEIIDVLMAYGVDINAKNDQSNTALYSACLYDNPDVVRCLIFHNADFSIKDDSSGWSPLHRACEEGHLNVVRVLLDAGANINDASKFEETPLYRAVAKGYEEIVKELVSRGADVTEFDSWGLLVVL